MSIRALCLGVRDRLREHLQDPEGTWITHEVRAIRPRPGQLITWPSYYFHNTVPCPAAGLRLTMGFDVVPLA